MSFVLLHADDAVTVLADDPIVPAAEVRHLHDAVALLDEAREQRAASGRGHDDAADTARRDGYAAGHAEGLAAGEAAVAAELFRLAARDAERTQARQAEVAQLAIELLRRLAGEIGEGEVVAGLATRAAAALDADAAAIVRVAPPALAATRDRLAGRPLLSVEADPLLTATDCVVETPLGRTHAGLDTQLAQIERIWQVGDGR